MSLVRRTVEAFPRGRTTEELLVLLDVDFNPERRRSVLAELSELSEMGHVRRTPDGRWRAARNRALGKRGAVSGGPIDGQPELSDGLIAAPAVFAENTSDEVAEAEVEDEKIDPQGLLRYWRSALRADPRGAIAQVEDRHGVDWHLVTGTGPVVPTQGSKLTLSVELDLLSDDFRQALLRRDANERGLAVGWPIAVGRRTGAPAIWPVGLLAAEWHRSTTHLEVTIGTDDVLVNPEWIKEAARATSWRETDLRELFNGSDSTGLVADDFLTRLREALAGNFRGRVTGRGLAAKLDPTIGGIYDSAALFLPNDSSFTSGAVRDLDEIANWSTERLARTALAPMLGLASNVEAQPIPAINIGPLNAEQISAVRHACEAPLAVVTGPPGTGKSQTIVSMVASVLAAGGNVLVASKNHQALDAVEHRLGELAPQPHFLVRTLDPAKEADQSFDTVIADLVREETAANMDFDESVHARLATLARLRARALDGLQEQAALECELADILDRIEARERFSVEEPASLEENAKTNQGLLTRIWFFLARLASGYPRSVEPLPLAEAAKSEGASTALLQARLQELRNAVGALDQPQDPLALTSEIAELTKIVLPNLLAKRAVLNEEQRLALAHAKDETDFLGARSKPSAELARQVLLHRPLWLASVLGTPKRVPLHDGLFDLVIFDEASQCDIASALPLVARAKRAVVVGDDRQLSFIPQLGRAQDRNLMQAQGLPSDRMARFAQSRMSLFDFAVRIPHVPRVLLKHQYRSAEDIVDYLSGEFYGGKLRTSYLPSSLKPPRGMRPGIVWSHVAAPSLPERGNVNTAEAEAIAVHIDRLLKDEAYEGSIGVISPFRPQVLVLEMAIRARVPASLLERADFRAATVDGFQGQERDLILFSPCLGKTSAQSAVSFVQKDWRRLNVAISRAKAVAHVFGDLDYARSNKVRSLARLAAIATEPRKRSGEGVFDSEWERRVFHALKERGLDPVPQYEIAGRRLDFALFGLGDVKLDIEVDGRRWHQDADGNRKISDIWRDHQLKSMGWRVRRFWVDELARDMEACLDHIERDLS